MIRVGGLGMVSLLQYSNSRKTSRIIGSSMLGGGGGGGGG